MLERLGIASELKAKALLTKGSGPALASVAAGKTAIVMTLISEILPVPGVQLVGPFPMELQNYVSFAAGAGGGASNSEAAKSSDCVSRRAKSRAGLQGEGTRAPLTHEPASRPHCGNDNFHYRLHEKISGDVLYEAKRRRGKAAGGRSTPQCLATHRLHKKDDLRYFTRAICNIDYVHARTWRRRLIFSIPTRDTRAIGACTNASFSKC